MIELQRAMDQAGIRFFSASELLQARRTGGTHPEPVDKINNIIQTLKIADAIRLAWGSGVRVLSAYRPLEYNRAVGSKDTSKHVLFEALDLRPVHGDIEEFYRVAHAAVEGARVDGLAVGFGMYNTFIHIDCGSRKVNATWDERK